MSKTQDFKRIYNLLNPAQKKAVDTIDGPVMVIAGPGTGKTQVLTARIAQILKKTDTNPSSILALTFTESAAKNMRERLVKMIGKTGYYVQISTFHSFCKEVIDNHPESFPIERDSTPLSDLERYEFFEEIFSDLNLEHIKPLNTPFFYIKDAIKSISDLKREGIGHKQYEELLKTWEKRLIATEPEKGKRANKKKGETSRTDWEKDQKQLNKNKELWEVYKTYQQKLRERKRYDFDDMIALVVDAFKEDDLLLREYQENLHYFLVDEYQDTNSAQNTVVDLLASYWEENANIFVVGDPNQAIYRFQGASIENMLEFIKKYPQSTVVTLDTGYRCPQNIYDTATKLIAHNNLGFEIDEKKISLVNNLKSPHGKGNKISLTTGSSQVLEAIQIAEQIKDLLKKKIPPHEIAVLYRHNIDRNTLAEVFDTWEIPYEVEGGGNALNEEIIRQLITLFRVIVAIRDTEETELLYETLQYDWLKEAFGWNGNVVLKLARTAGKTKEPLLDLIEKGVDGINKSNPGFEVTPIEMAPLEMYVEKLKLWDSADANQTFPAFFEQVIQESGLLPWIKNQPSKVFFITVLNSLFSEIKKLVNHNHQFKLIDFLRSIELIEEHNLQITIEDLNVRKQAVHLSTVHKAKGREWEQVFLYQCVDKKWGNNRKRELIKLPAEILLNTNLDAKERNEDERRLFYVALTRAKKQVIISHPETIITEGRSRDVVPSMFLTEVQESDESKNAWQEVDTTLDEENSADYLAKLLEPDPTPSSLVTSHKEKLYLNWLLDNFRWSVTALNTYLRSPEEFIHNTLLRVPRAKIPQLAFGTAMHNTMEFLYKTFQQTGEYPELNSLKKQFEIALEQEILDLDEHKKRLKYGQEVLDRYYLELEHKNPNPLFIERFFGSGKQKVYLDDIALTGRIDRIDWIDVKKKQVKVVDFKTGKARSANEIEGKTVSSNLSERERDLPESIRGPYKRQLLFYKLLTKLDKSFPYEVLSGEFEFVEPNPRDKIVVRNFELLDEDVKELEKLIKSVVKELRGEWK